MNKLLFKEGDTKSIGHSTINKKGNVKIFHTKNEIKGKK